MASLLNYEIIADVSESGSISKTASRLNITPSAISHAINKSESEMGNKIFIRKRSGMETTEFGDEILPYINQILETNRRLDHEIDLYTNKAKGEIRIGAFNSVCCAWMPDIARLVRNAYPDVKITVIENGYDPLEQLISDDFLDLAFVSLPARKGIITIPLYRDRLLCITPRDFTPKNSKYITIDELSKLGIITPGTGSDFDAAIFLKSNHLMQKNNHDIISDTSIVALVEGGIGVSIMPELVIENIAGDVNIYPVESAPTRLIGLAVSNPEFSTSTTGKIKNIIVDYVLEKYPDEIPYFQKDIPTTIAGI